MLLTFASALNPVHTADADKRRQSCLVRVCVVNSATVYELQF